MNVAFVLIFLGFAHSGASVPLANLGTFATEFQCNNAITDYREQLDLQSENFEFKCVRVKNLK